MYNRFKISLEQIKEIQESSLSDKELAEKYNILKSAVLRYKNINLLERE